MNTHNFLSKIADYLPKTTNPCQIWITECLKCLTMTEGAYRRVVE